MKKSINNLYTETISNTQYKKIKKNNKNKN